MSFPFLFGVPGLDDILTGCPIAAPKGDDPGSVWTGAIVGPDGCGKSILSLLLASNYWLQHTKKGEKPKVLYISTDLAHSQAEKQWKAFGCKFPERRLKGIYDAYHTNELPPEQAYSFENNNLAIECELMKLNPRNENSLKQFLDPTTSPGVYFLDLHSSTTGDDWGFVNRLLGLLGHNDKGSPISRMLILDAIEGLEAMVGDGDAYGQDRSRRSRIVQLLRNARAAQSHTLLVVEKGDGKERNPEQFVTDMVLQLRIREEYGYFQRTVEIEKCRSMPHARGPHDFGIRSGAGTTTGEGFHLDDPRIDWGNDSTLAAPTTSSAEEEQKYLAHINVIKSLHLWNRGVREEVAPLPRLIGNPSFCGLELLNNSLESSQAQGAPDPTDSKGSLSVLSGDVGTLKSLLADHFLAAAFLSASDNRTIDLETGSAILITTGYTDVDALAKRITAILQQHCDLPDLTEEQKTKLRRRLFCRRVGVHHTGSSLLMAAVEPYVKEAQRRVGASSHVITERRNHSHKVHFVLDDWSHLLAMHPNFKDDPLLVQSLLGLLKREGLTSLIVSTQTGAPNARSENHDQFNLRRLDEHQIYAWNVPFFGERRIAITGHPPGIVNPNPAIYELATDPQRASVTVSRSFELYSDVERGLPKRIPLVVRLYEGLHPVASDADTSPEYASFLHATLSQAFEAPEGEALVRFEPFHSYDTLQSYVGTAGGTRHDHSIVVQVDEFWQCENNRQGQSHFANLTSYWDEFVCTWSTGADNYVRHNELDSFGLLQPHRWIDRKEPPTVSQVPKITSRTGGNNEKVPNESKLKRSDFFLDVNDGKHSNLDVDRIPYTWDFGVLLVRRDVWYRYRKQKINDSRSDSNANSSSKGIFIEEIWRALCLPGAELTNLNANTPKIPVSWELFLAACEYIALRESCDPFCFDRSSPETLNCLILELWASIDGDIQKAPGSERANDSVLSRLSNRSSKSAASLRNLLEDSHATLYIALQYLLRYCPSLRAPRHSSEPLNSCCNAIASREWYHTASARMRSEPDNHDLEVIQLPGQGIVRGDWNLAVMKGSRSLLLAQHAIDLLTSRRLNLLRLKDGVGLPVRDISVDQFIGKVSTAITSRSDLTHWRREAVEYEKYCQLGASPSTNDSDRKWLWRSAVANYGRSMFYFRKWLDFMLHSNVEWFVRHEKFEEEMDTAARVALKATNGIDWSSIEGKWYESYVTENENPNVQGRKSINLKQFHWSLKEFVAVLRD